MNDFYDIPASMVLITYGLDTQVYIGLKNELLLI